MQFGVFADTKYLIRIGARAGAPTTIGGGILELFVYPIMGEECVAASKVNRDAAVDLSDAVWLLNYLFVAG